MKGLEQYVGKHGMHFTEELASEVTNGKWNPSKVEKDAQRHMYYNVTGSTLGDMMYLMTLGDSEMPYNKKVKMMLSWVGDYSKEGSPFCIWLAVLTVSEESFDFTPYI